MTIDAISLSQEDNVATAIRNSEKGETVVVSLGDKTKSIKIDQAISYGHKFALKRIKTGEAILKYGETIGRATEDIITGRHAHVHNIESLRGRGDVSTKGIKK
jgi:altronate dehydratase small subunit